MMVPQILCKQFGDRVDRLLSQRNGLAILRFLHHWACRHKDNCDIDLNLIDKWIGVSVNCQVQEINLEVGIAEEDPFSESEENSSLDEPSFGSEENSVF